MFSRLPPPLKLRRDKGGFDEALIPHEVTGGVMTLDLLPYEAVVLYRHN